MRTHLVRMQMAVVAALFVGSAAHASTFTVTTTADTDGTCSSTSCSLREAIKAANNAPDRDFINFASNVRGTISVTNGEFALTWDVSITGPGASNLTIRRDGGSSFTLFSVAVGATAGIGSVTLANGSGAIINRGSIGVNNCVFSGNSGLVLSNYGTVGLFNSTFSGNSNGSGGTCINNEGTIEVSNITLVGNLGSAVRNRGTAQINSCTIVGNAYGVLSDASAGASARTEVTNSIIAANGETSNASSDVNFQGANSFLSRGYNLIGKGNATPVFNQTGDSIGLGINDLKLDPLRDNGGSTPTVAPLAGSPAVDAGNTSFLIDQRGLGRPSGSADDIGAVEVQNPDLSRPIVSITQPTSNVLVQEMPPVSGRASDVGSGVHHVDVVIKCLSSPLTPQPSIIDKRWDGTTWTPTDIGVRATVDFSSASVLGLPWAVNSNLPSGSNLVTGTYELKAVAYDVAGNIKTAIQNIVIDNTRPAVTISSPVPDVSVSAMPSVSGTVSDIGSGVHHVDLVIKCLSSTNAALVDRRWDGTTWTPTDIGVRATLSGSSWAVTSNLPTGSNLSPGTYELKAVAYDNARNIKTVTQNITIVAVNTTAKNTKPGKTIKPKTPKGSVKSS